MKLSTVITRIAGCAAATVTASLLLLPGSLLLAQQKDGGTTLGTAAKKPSSSSKRKSLADVAGSVKLKTSSTGDGGVTISNHNLQEMGKNAVVSVGGGVNTGSAVASPSPEESVGEPAASNENLQQSYNEQSAKVKAIEGGLADFEKEVASQDPHFGIGPHQRSPGMQNPNDLTRDKVNAELDAEKKKLESIRAQAAEQGVQLKDPE